MPKKRAVIIGKDVSKGARSPILWNAAYKALDIEAEMTPVDINSAEEAKVFLDAEITKPEFIGGAVAAPLKEVVADYFSDGSTGFIEPKNCFFKTSTGFKAANTDTLALLESIYSEKPKESVQRIGVLGTGGVAKSLCFQLSNPKNIINVDVYGRSNETEAIFSTFKANFKNYDQLDSELKNYDVLINCTSIGKDGNDDESILDPSHLAKLNDDCLLFDVNYINSPSKLIRDARSLSVKCIDGARMNLMQAVIGFCLANDLAGHESSIYGHMSKEIEQR